VTEEPTQAPADVAAPAGQATDEAPQQPATSHEAGGQSGSGGQFDAGGHAESGKPPEAARDPWSDPRLPWEGKPRRVDIACWAAITLSGLYYFAVLPFRASLVGTHPIILVLLNGSTEGLISAAAFARVNHGTLAWVLLASIPGLMKFDLIFWWAGRLWGERIIHVFAGQRKRTRQRGERFAARVHRWGRWFTWPAVIVAPFLPFPSAIIYGVAGWTGMRLVTFLVLDAIGSLAWAGMLVGLGYQLGHRAVTVAQEVSRYGLWVTIGIVVLVVAAQLRGVRAQR